MALIAEKGPAGFTIAEAARLAGVSPAAPYRHFRDAEALLAEVALRGFERFAAALAAAWNNGRPDTLRAFEAIGRAYLAFARSEPAYYAAMFETRISFETTQPCSPPVTAPSPCCARRPNASLAALPPAQAAALADDRTACLGAVTRHRVAVRARRPVAAEAADVAGGSAGSRRPDIPAKPRPRRRSVGRNSAAHPANATEPRITHSFSTFDHRASPAPPGFPRHGCRRRASPPSSPPRCRARR